MKVKALTKEEAAEILEKHPTRAKGQWTQIFERVKKTGQPVEVSDLSKGSIAGAARKAKELGLPYRAFYKDGRFLVLPPEKPAK